MLYLCTVFTNTSGLSGGMVDTKDLKSFGHYGCAGSSPASSTKRDKSPFWWLVFLFVSSQLLELELNRNINSFLERGSISSFFLSYVF